MRLEMRHLCVARRGNDLSRICFYVLYNSVQLPYCDDLSLSNVLMVLGHVTPKFSFAR